MLSDVPTIAHFVPHPTRAQALITEQLVSTIRDEHPELAGDEQFRKLMPISLQDGCCVHLDDLSEIHLDDCGLNFQHMQDRARLRAGNGDLVVSVVPESEGYEEYCSERLQLGFAEWLRPHPTANPLQIAHACWEDRKIRHELLHRLRNDTLHYVHPHMGTLGCWELAALLHEHSRRPIKVISAPPALARLVNNKVVFADIARRLLGASAVPVTTSAWNMATLTQRISELSESVKTVGVKRPDSAGGDGIIVIPMQNVRGRSLPEVHRILVELLEPLHWDDGCQMLVGTWEDNVLCSPSAQLWIPPEADGPPKVEGIFTQHMRRGTVEFDGTGFVEFPDEIVEELSTQAWLIGRLFQQLGYIGRCSFDTILLGESIKSSRIAFIECNGRWGGTSMPMTLMNRLFGDWKQQPFAVRTLGAEGLNQLSFAELLYSLGDHVFDARTRSGQMIFYTPDRLRRDSEITVIALAESWDSARKVLRNSVPGLLKQAAQPNVPQ